MIPTLVSRRLAGGDDAGRGVPAHASVFEGSVAIGAATAAAPDRLQLALRGSGQALYVGLAEDAFVVASEPYGLVEETLDYVRMDGETPANPANPTASRGQLMVLDHRGRGHRGRHRAPGLRRHRAARLRRRRGHGRDHHPRHRPPPLRPLPAQGDHRGAEPPSARRCAASSSSATGRLRVVAGPRHAARRRCAARLREGRITPRAGHRPGHRVGGRLRASPGPSSRRSRASTSASSPLAATELSGFHLRADMSNTLVVAISQSGTTTDTNRTVDLVRSRGASVVAVVNRRNSDLTDKADGVLYTSDGRDVEMSVASTKAFYSQVAAGFLLAHAIADEVLADPRYQHSDAAGAAAARGRSDLLAALRDMPDALEATMERRPAIAAAAQQLAPSKRYWAVVGSGADQVAAAGDPDQALGALLQVHRLRHHRGQEAHRPLVRAAHPRVRHRPVRLQRRRRGQGGGDLPGPQGHADRHRHRGRGALHRRAAGPHRARRRTPARLRPRRHGRPPLRLRGRAWPSTPRPRPLREARAAIEQLRRRRRRRRRRAHGRAGARSSSRSCTAGSTACARACTTATSRPAPPSASPRCSATPPASPRSSATRSSTASSARPASSSTTSSRRSPPASTSSTRPIDAIKHQAKTVTVGISRSDEGALAGPAGARGARGRRRPRPAELPHAAHRSPSLDPAVAEVIGFTRYRIEGRIATARRHHRGGRPGRHLARPPAAHRGEPVAAGHQAPRGRSSARSPSPSGAATVAPW